MSLTQSYPMLVSDYLEVHRLYAKFSLWNTMALRAHSTHTIGNMNNGAKYSTVVLQCHCVFQKRNLSWGPCIMNSTMLVHFCKCSESACVHIAGQWFILEQTDKNWPLLCMCTEVSMPLHALRGHEYQIWPAHQRPSTLIFLYSTFL